MRDDITIAYAEFIIFDFTWSIDEVTKTVGFKPTYAHFKGEVINGRISKNNVRVLKSTLSKHIEIEKHIQELIDKIKPYRRNLSRLPNAKFCIDCLYESDYISPGVHLTKKTIKDLADLQVSLDLDIYSFYDKEKYG